MKRLPGLAAAARRELTSYIQPFSGPFKDPSSICKGCSEAPNLDLHHAHAVSFFGGRLELITKGAQFTDQYQPIRRLPAVGRVPLDCQTTFALGFSWDSCCFITATDKDGIRRWIAHFTSCQPGQGLTLNIFRAYAWATCWWRLNKEGDGNYTSN